MAYLKWVCGVVLLLGGCGSSLQTQVRMAPVVSVPMGISVTVVEGHTEVGRLSKGLAPKLGDAVAKVLRKDLGWTVENGAEMCSVEGHCLSRLTPKRTDNFLGIPFKVEDANDVMCLSPAQAALPTWKLAVAVLPADSRVTMRGHYGDRIDSAATVVTFRLWNPENQLVLTQAYWMDIDGDDGRSVYTWPDYDDIRLAEYNFGSVDTTFDITPNKKVVVESAQVGARYFASLFRTWITRVNVTVVFLDDGKHLKNGNALAEKKRWAEAFAAWESAPDSSELHFNRGMVHFVRGEDAMALAEIQRSEAMEHRYLAQQYLTILRDRVRFRAIHQFPEPGCVAPR